MSVTVLMEPTIAPGKTEEMVALMTEILPDTRTFDGCEGVVMHRDQDAPERVILIEQWASRGHFEAYFAWRGERGDGDRLGALSAGPPSVRYLDAIHG